MDSFEDLDKPLLECIAASDSPHMKWEANDLLIRSYFELPVPIALAGGILEYEFSISGGDIGFQLVNVIDEETEKYAIINNMERMEVASSKLEAVESGIYIFQFDNTYSWFHSKMLNYKITYTLKHNFEQVEQERIMKCEHMLNSIVRYNHEQRHQNLAKTQEITHYNHETLQYMDQIHELQEAVRKNNENVEICKETIHANLMQINKNEEIICGLCIRMLNCSLLGLVFEFLVGDSRLVQNVINTKDRSQVSASGIHFNGQEMLNLMSVSKLWLKVVQRQVLGQQLTAKNKSDSVKEEVVTSK